MTARKVVDLTPPEDVKPPRPTGYGGRIWDAERMRTTGKWALVGRIPGRPNSFSELVPVRYASRGVDSADLVREIARRLMLPEPFPYEATEEDS